MLTHATPRLQTHNSALNRALKSFERAVAQHDKWQTTMRARVRTALKLEADYENQKKALAPTSSTVELAAAMNGPKQQLIRANKEKRDAKSRHGAAAEALKVAAAHAIHAAEAMEADLRSFEEQEPADVYHEAVFYMPDGDGEDDAHDFEAVQRRMFGGRAQTHVTVHPMEEDETPPPSPQPSPVPPRLSMVARPAAPVATRSGRSVRRPVSKQDIAEEQMAPLLGAAAAASAAASASASSSAVVNVSTAPERLTQLQLDEVATAMSGADLEETLGIDLEHTDDEDEDFEPTSSDEEFIDDEEFEEDEEEDSE